MATTTTSTSTSTTTSSTTTTTLPPNTYIKENLNNLEVWVDGVKVARLNSDGSVDLKGNKNPNAF